MAPCQEADGENLGKSLIFSTIMACYVYSLESPQ